MRTIVFQLQLIRKSHCNNAAASFRLAECLIKMIATNDDKLDMNKLTPYTINLFEYDYQVRRFGEIFFYKIGF